jgi:hypothetical protein
MWSNYPVLKVKDILTMSKNSIRRSMSLSKHQEYGMNDLVTSLLKIVLGLVSPTLLSSLEKWVKICLYTKAFLNHAQVEIINKVKLAFDRPKPQTPKAVGKSSSMLAHWLCKNCLKETKLPKGQGLTKIAKA